MQKKFCNLDFLCNGSNTDVAIMNSTRFYMCVCMYVSFSILHVTCQAPQVSEYPEWTQAWQEAKPVSGIGKGHRLPTEPNA